MDKEKVKELIIDKFTECEIDGYVDIVIKNKEVDVFIKNEFSNLYWFFIYLNSGKCEILINGRFDYYEMQYLAMFTEYCRDLLIVKSIKFKQLEFVFDKDIKGVK